MRAPNGPDNLADTTDGDSECDTLLAALLFAAVCAVTVNADLAGQVKKQPNKKAKGQYDPPAAKKPNDATMKQIAAKTEQLRRPSRR